MRKYHIYIIINYIYYTIFSWLLPEFFFLNMKQCYFDVMQIICSFDVSIVLMLKQLPSFRLYVFCTWESQCTVTIRDRKCGLRLIIHRLCKDHEEDRVSLSSISLFSGTIELHDSFYIPISTARNLQLCQIWNCRFYFIIMISSLINFQTNAFTSIKTLI